MMKREGLKSDKQVMYKNLYHAKINLAFKDNWKVKTECNSFRMSGKQPGHILSPSIGPGGPMAPDGWVSMGTVGAQIWWGTLSEWIPEGEPSRVSRKGAPGWATRVWNQCQEYQF